MPINYPACPAAVASEVQFVEARRLSEFTGKTAISNEITDFNRRRDTRANFVESFAYSIAIFNYVLCLF